MDKREGVGLVYFGWNNGGGGEKRYFYRILVGASEESVIRYMISTGWKIDLPFREKKDSANFLL